MLTGQEEAKIECGAPTINADIPFKVDLSGRPALTNVLGRIELRARCVNSRPLLLQVGWHV